MRCRGRVPAGASRAYETGARDVALTRARVRREYRGDGRSRDASLSRTIVLPAAQRAHGVPEPHAQGCAISRAHRHRALTGVEEVRMPDIQIRCLESIGTREVDGLSDVLIDCVEGGASVSFMLPMSRAKAEAYWQSTAASLARGERLVLAAEDAAGTIVGTVQVILSQPENQPHRGDLAKMLVHRRGRRRGVGAALLAAAERTALGAGKTLLVLDTASDEAERLYARQGWQRCRARSGLRALWPMDPCATTFFSSSCTSELAISAPARQPAPRPSDGQRRERRVDRVVPAPARRRGARTRRFARASRARRRWMTGAVAPSVRRTARAAEVPISPRPRWRPWPRSSSVSRRRPRGPWRPPRPPQRPSGRRWRSRLRPRTWR